MKYIKIVMLFCGMLSLFSAKLIGQNTNEITLESMVQDRDGSPVTDAAVYGNEGKTILYTDASGRFTITVPISSILFISANGFKSQTVKVETALAKIVLEKDSVGKMINVAYKKIESRDLPGAISVLNPGDYIDKDYNFSVIDGITGRVGGMLWYNNIWGIENALVMIDGVPRNFSDIRFDEVDQITILKGINAIVLYGSQAAKGVIMITTKRGEAFIRKINVRANSGLGFPIIYPKYLGSAEFMTLYNEARVNDDLQKLYSDELINNFKNGNRFRYPDIDYYSSKYLKNYVNFNDINTEFSGGNKDARFYSNIGWANQSTLLKIGEGKNESDNRFNVRGNVDLNLNEYISCTVDMSARLEDSRRGLGNYWYNASILLPNKYSPLIPISMITPDSASAVLMAKRSKDIIDGKYILGGTQEYLTNPIADMYVGGYIEYINRVLQFNNKINVDLNSLLKGLSFQTRFNADYYNSYTQTVSNKYAVYTPTWDTIPGSTIITGLQQFGEHLRTGSQIMGATAQTKNLGFSLQFNYSGTWNDVHNISAILLASGTSISRNGIYQSSTNSNLGLQLGYNYNHKYYIDFSGAFINSTKLPENNRTAFSPTVSLGWLINSENFLSGVTAIDHLKLTTSLGIVNTDLYINNYYLYDNTYTSGSWFSWSDNMYSNQATSSLQGANPNLSFVKRKEFNLGLEGAFFKRLLTLESTFFITRIDGLPAQRFSQYPSYFRPWVPYTNYNINQYSGVDMAMNFEKKLGEIELNLGANVTYVTSKVIKRDELYSDSYQNRTGKHADAIFGLVSEGFFMDETEIANHPKQVFGEVQPGDIKYADQNGDNIIDESDEVEIGRWTAPWNYGLNVSVSYKNFTVFMLGTGSIGGNGMKDGDYYWVDGDNKYSEVVRNRWTESTKNTASHPRLSSQQNNNNFRYSDFWIYKTDYFNLNKIQVTYDLPASILKRTFIRKLGVYAMGNNLLTFSANKDILLMNIGGEPLLRYFILGLKADF